MAAAGGRSLKTRGPLLAVGAALSVAIVLQALPALGLGQPDPAVQLRRAAGLMTLSPSAADLARGEAMARDALDRAPMSSRAISLLGQARERGGKAAEGERLVKAAYALNHRDPVADLWLFDQALRARRYDEAFLHADALLRRDPVGYDPIMDAVYAAAADPAALKPLAARLAPSPPWREPFFVMMFARRAQPFTYPLFEALRTAGSPPTDAEMGQFLRSLVRDERYDQAYLFWLLSLPRGAMENLGYIFDGEFEGRPMGEPFGWRVMGNAGGAASMEAAPGGGKALLVNSDGYTPGAFAQQLIVLPPGRYQLTGRVQTPPNAPVQVLAWTLSCLPKSDPLVSVPTAPTDGAWRRFSAAFTVPAGCTAQTLALKAQAGELRTSMTIWYDDLSILPVRGAQVAEARP